MPHYRSRLAKLEAASCADRPIMFFTYRSAADAGGLREIRARAKQAGAVLFTTIYEAAPDGEIARNALS